MVRRVPTPAKLAVVTGGLAAVFLALLAPSSGHAQTAPAPAAAAPAAAPDVDLQLAKSEFETAQTLFIKDQFADAASHFLAAFTRKPFPAFLFNAAVSFEKAKNLEKASEFFQKYLDRDPDAPDAAAVKSRIDAIKTILSPPPPTPGAVSPPPVVPALPAIETKGLVVIESKPQGATIYLDNKTNGVFAKTPWQGSMESKPVKLILEAKGFKPEERSISPRSDKLVDVYIALSEEHFLGWVEIVSNVPGAEVFLDRKDIGAIGKTPFTGHVKPGKHTIYLERIGFKPIQREIDVLPGTATQHMITLEKGDNGWINVAGRGAYGAKVSIDKKVACTAPCRSEVTPGVHQVMVQKGGFEDYDASLRVDQGAETVVEVGWSARPSKRALDHRRAGGRVHRRRSLRGIAVEPELRPHQRRPEQRPSRLERSQVLPGEMGGDRRRRAVRHRRAPRDLVDGLVLLARA